MDLFSLCFSVLHILSSVESVFDVAYAQKLSFAGTGSNSSPSKNFQASIGLVLPVSVVHFVRKGHANAMSRPNTEDHNMIWLSNCVAGVWKEDLWGRRVAAVCFFDFKEVSCTCVPSCQVLYSMHSVAWFQSLSEVCAVFVYFGKVLWQVCCGVQTFVLAKAEEQERWAYVHCRPARWLMPV